MNRRYSSATRSVCIDQLALQLTLPRLENSGVTWTLLCVVSKKLKVQLQVTLNRQSFYIFFEDKLQKIHKDTSTSLEPTFEQHSGDKFSEFTLTNCDTILKLIKDAPNTHCARHPAPTWLVNSCAHLLAPFICLVVNRSLSDYYFPASQEVGIRHSDTEETRYRQVRS